MYKIEIIQIICPIHKRSRTEENSLQYTLRILPPFLIRNSRQFTKEILNAIEKFPNQSILDISNHYDWQDIRTFTRYWKRAVERRDYWNQKLLEQVIALGGSIPIPGIDENIDENMLPAKLIQKLTLLLHEKLRMEIMTIDDGREFFLALMSSLKLDLGPP